MKLINSSILATLVAASVLSLPALAGPQEGLPQRTLTLTDLNLGTAAGARAAYRRIRAVAESLCGLADNTDQPYQAAYRKCVDSTVQDTVEKLNQREVTRYAKSQRKAKPAKPDSAA